MSHLIWVPLVLAAGAAAYHFGAQWLAKAKAASDAALDVLKK